MMMIQITKENPYSIPVGTIFKNAKRGKLVYIVETKDRTYYFPFGEAVVFYEFHNEIPKAS
jgi:hypothetical protein